MCAASTSSAVAQCRCSAPHSGRRDGWRRPPSSSHLAYTTSPHRAKRARAVSSTASIATQSAACPWLPRAGSDHASMSRMAIVRNVGGGMRGVAPPTTHVLLSMARRVSPKHGVLYGWCRPPLCPHTHPPAPSAFPTCPPRKLTHFHPFMTPRALCPTSPCTGHCLQTHRSHPSSHHRTVAPSRPSRYRTPHKPNLPCTNARTSSIAIHVANVDTWRSGIPIPCLVQSRLLPSHQGKPNSVLGHGQVQTLAPCDAVFAPYPLR